MTPADHYRRKEATVSISTSAHILNADCLTALRDMPDADTLFPIDGAAS